MNFELVSRSRPPDDIEPTTATPAEPPVLRRSEIRRILSQSGPAIQAVQRPEGLLLLTPDACPDKVYIEITTECNLDCAMCSRHSWDSPGGRMTLGTFRRILDQLEDLPGVSTLNFSGYGEPLSHPSFFGFVTRAREAGLAVEVITNGTLLNRRTSERLIDLEVSRIVVSLDGVRAHVSRSLHRDTFPRVAGNLGQLNQLRIRRAVAYPEVVIEFVATKRNIGELPSLKRLAPELGFSAILVSNLIPSTPEMAREILYERWATANRTRPVSPWNPCVDFPQMDASSDANGVWTDLRLTATRLRINGRDVAGMEPRCRFVTEGRLAIRWDGNVSPCLPLLHSHSYWFRDKPKHFGHYHVGNVNTTPLRAIWEAEGYRSFRDRVRRFDFAPCIDCGGCNFRESNREDCFGDVFPRCGECLWAHGIIQCP